jgi:ABC-type bacteriocin/lantibiotic exporter with double-glycine peptidase domain
LYVLLQLRGCPYSYEACLSRTTGPAPPNTLADLASLASKLGCQLSVRQLSPDDLTRIPLPIIVHTYGDNPSTGAFHLLLFVRDKNVICFNGASATILRMPRETFLRQWSAICLFPATEPSHSIDIFLGTTLGIALAMWCTRRRGYG